MKLDDILKQAQQMQSKLSDAQDSLAEATVTGESGAGLVKVTMNGRHEALRVEVDPSIGAEEGSVLEDLLVAAINDAVRRIAALHKERIGDLAQGMGLPAGLKLPF